MSSRRGVLVAMFAAAMACTAPRVTENGPAATEATETPAATATPTPAPATGPQPCTLPPDPALILLYSGVGGTKSYDFLKSCAGEVVVGEKHAAHPTGVMKTEQAHLAGGRTGFILANNGRDIRDLLMRTNGVDRTVTDLKAELASGYDYIIIDEITADPSWADGSTLNLRFRELLTKMPRNTIIAYISIDLTQYSTGAAKMNNRKYLLRALKRRGRALALEVYLHTGAVMNGAAYPAMRLAADRIANAVSGIPGGAGINKKAITVLGTTIHGNYAQYRYLDQPSHDLQSIARQAAATRHASTRVMQQRGLGYYFVGSSDLEPLSGAPYTKNDLIARMVLEAKRAKR